MTIVYFSCGRVTLKNCRTRPAPSSVAASYIEAGICRTPAWYSSEWNGTNDHEITMITV